MHTSSCPPASVLISIDREDVRARLAHDIAVLTRLHPQYARFSAMLTGDAPLTSLVPAVLDTEPFLYRTLFEPLFRSLARPEADRAPVVRVVSRPALAPRPMPPPPNPRPATPAPVSPLLLSHLSTLDWNTPEIGPLEPYAYMLRAGFTPDAVLARMRSSGVDDTSINALFGQVKPPARPPRPQGSSGGGASTDETLNVRDLVCTNSPVISSLIAVNTAASVDDVVNGWKRLHAVFLYYGLSDVEDPFVKAHLRQVMVSIAWALRSRFSAEHWNRRVTASFRLAMQALAV